MTKKLVSIPARSAKKRGGGADDWVRNRAEAAGEGLQEPVKRLTLDLPAGLHARIKARCAMEGTTMRAMLMDFLEQKYPDSR